MTIHVSDEKDRSCHGYVSDLRDLGDTLYQAEVADFTSVSDQGLYKSLIKMISEVVPEGTKYKSSIWNIGDQKALLKYVKENETLNIKEALEGTCFGHILLASEFSDVQVFYKSQDETSEGIQALQKFNADNENRIYTSSHGTNLFLIGTKKPKTNYTD